MQKFSIRGEKPSHTTVQVQAVEPGSNSPLSSPVIVPPGEEMEFTPTPHKAFLVTVTNNAGFPDTPAPRTGLSTVLTGAARVAKKGRR